jgi:hypothetical protein
MGAVATQTVAMIGIDAATGEKVSVDVRVPVGPIVEPTAEAKRIMGTVQNKGNWKLATKPYYTFDADVARQLAYCYDFYFGGHELTKQVDFTGNGIVYVVTSKGYYFYVGI